MMEKFSHEKHLIPSVYCGTVSVPCRPPSPTFPSFAQRDDTKMKTSYFDYCDCPLFLEGHWVHTDLFVLERHKQSRPNRFLLSEQITIDAFILDKICCEHLAYSKHFIRSQNSHLYSMSLFYWNVSRIQPTGMRKCMVHMEGVYHQVRLQRIHKSADNMFLWNRSNWYNMYILFTDRIASDVLKSLGTTYSFTMDALLISGDDTPRDGKINLINGLELS